MKFEFKPGALYSNLNNHIEWEAQKIGDGGTLSWIVDEAHFDHL